jgi:glycosyltransferase involved in cell wall biosynthesis
MATPLVSILLLTRDGAATIPAVLAAIATQERSFPLEVVAVDSGSRDGSLDILRSSVDRLVEIPPGAFNHGASRNLGIDACRAPFIVLLVQDAEPASPTWLSRLVAPLQEDEGVAGTYARQASRPGAPAVMRNYQDRYAAASVEPRLQSLGGPDALAALAPAERLSACTFDNVCSCVRRAVWQAHPFKATRIAEDLEWARDVMLAGHCIKYVPEAVVLHSHDRPARYELMRTYLVHQRLRSLLGLATVPSVPALARSIAVSADAHARWVLSAPVGLGSKLAQFPRAAALAVAFPLGQYLGAKSADTGREYLRARGI